MVCGVLVSSKQLALASRRPLCMAAGASAVVGGVAIALGSTPEVGVVAEIIEITVEAIACGNSRESKLCTVAQDTLTFPVTSFTTKANQETRKRQAEQVRCFGFRLRIPHSLQWFAR